MTIGTHLLYGACAAN